MKSSNVFAVYKNQYFKLAQKYTFIEEKNTFSKLKCSERQGIEKSNFKIYF